METLAKFIHNKREELGYTVKGLSIATNIPLEEIEEIEEGFSIVGKTEDGDEVVLDPVLLSENARAVAGEEDEEEE